MIEVLENFDLTPFNTFGVSAKARYFTSIDSEEGIKQLFASEIFLNNPHVFLGGGSNVLFIQDFPGLVVLNKLDGIFILEENDEYVWVRALSGTLWHDLVLFAVSHDWWGIENLALIPGTVGGAPMQNIGAYGSEARESIYEVEAYDINTGEKRIFKNEECRFGYRDSVFKQELKNKYFISAVVWKLGKTPKVNTSYKILADYIEKNRIEIKTPKDISNAVVSIRESKLPNPKLIGNAGSFFKNVYIEETKIQELLNTYPEMPYFKEEGKIKIPTGWLVEQCGFKGQRFGNVGVHDKQALVLVNHGGGTGRELYELALKIIDGVRDKFDLEITPEVNII